MSDDEQDIFISDVAETSTEALLVSMGKFKLELLIMEAANAN